MTKFLNVLRDLFKFEPVKTQRQLDEEYLAGAYDLADLERRLKEIETKNPHLYRR